MSEQARPRFAFTVTRSVVPRYELRGPDTPELSVLLNVLLLAGLEIEVKAARRRYVLTGPIEMLQRMAQLVADTPNATEAGFVIEPETAPAEISIGSKPVRTSRYLRVTELQGADFYVTEAIARAVDYRLTPRHEGADRWTVTGPSEHQMRWAAEVVVKKPLAEVMKALGVTAAMVAREDRDGTPVAINALPRASTTTLVHGPDGELVKSMTTERDVPDDDGGEA